MECLEDKLFDHPNFVWLDHASINEILTRRKANSCEPMTIYNNLLRWSLYQLDRYRAVTDFTIWFLKKVFFDFPYLNFEPKPNVLTSKTTHPFWYSK